MRGVKSLAYDLVVYVGRVNSRVALLLRSVERKPTVSDLTGDSPPPERFPVDLELVGEHLQRPDFLYGFKYGRSPGTLEVAVGFSRWPVIHKNATPIVGL